MSTKTDGIGGIKFVNDMIKHLKDEWVTGTGGKIPDITAQWGKKVVGLGTNKYQEIIISLDSEDPKIFSLISSIGVDGKFDYDWLHDISITLDIRTGTSETRVLQLVSEVVKILKNNVVTTIDNTEYVQILPGNVVSLNEEYRNLFRYTVDVDAMRFNV